MWEKLSGLYGAFDSLLGSCGTNILLKQKFEVSQKYGKILSESYQEQSSLLECLLSEKKGILKDCQEFLDTKDSFLSYREHTIKSFRDACSNMQSDLTRCIQERESLKIKNLDLESKYSEVSEALRKLRQKVSLRFSSTSEVEEEKYCLKCNKTYVEYNNYNWSCRTHLGVFHESTYWCCGKQGKDAPGCIVSRHMTKEEVNGGGNAAEVGPAAVFCISCKKHGHCINECPKDPNLKTKADLRDEIDRLEQLHVPKKRKNSMFGMHGKQNLGELSGKMHGNRFEDENSSDEGDYDCSEGEKPLAFSDLMGIREELDLDERDKWFSVNMARARDISGGFLRKYTEKRRSGLLITKHFSKDLEEEDAS